MRAIITTASIVLALTLASTARSEPQIRFVTDLYTIEIFEGHVFQDGHLWVARRGESETLGQRVDVFDGDGIKKIATVDLPHSPRYMYAYGDDQVIVTGKSTWPWKSHATVISRNGSRFTARTTDFPDSVIVEEFAGNATAWYLNEPGSRGIYHWSSNRLHKLDMEISNPGQMIFRDGYLWVLERRGFAPGDEDIAYVHPQSNTKKSVFGDKPRMGLTDLMMLDDMNILVGAEYAANQVMFLDTDSRELIATTAVKGTPRGLARMGHCLVVVSEESKYVHFLDLEAPDFGVIGAWDVSSAGDKLKRPRKVAVNPQTGLVFLRSTYACPSCTVTQSSVVAVSEPNGDMVDRCQN